MSLPNKDELEGKFDRAKGAAKEKVGRALGNKDLEQEGADERAKGDVQEKIGGARRKVGDAIKDIGQKIRQ